MLLNFTPSARPVSGTRGPVNGGNAPISACVYGWRGAVWMSLELAVSTILPPYNTAIRCESSTMRDMSCVMNRTEKPSSRCIARLEKPTAGRILLNGTDVLKRDRFQASREYRAQMQMVFQDPFGSLNPVHRIEHFLTRSLTLHGKAGTPDQLRTRLDELMTTVGLTPDMLNSYPHELSGGQRQRVAIARALAVEPEVILADEPTSMLDVSVRIGILNLLRGLRDDKGISMLYITHDLASARSAGT